MLDETLKKRLKKDRAVTSITLRIPVDVVDSLKAIAPRKGFSGYQTLLKSYISDGLRRDESAYAPATIERLSAALRKHGVSKKVLDDALRDVSSSHSAKSSAKQTTARSGLQPQRVIMAAKSEAAPGPRLPKDPLLRLADTALRRAAKKAQERALATGSAKARSPRKTAGR